MKKKWYGVIFALIVLFLYVMGAYDFFMMLGHDEMYYASHGYGENVVTYFTDYPVCFMVFWVANLICGILSPVLYILNRKSCSIVAFLSAASDAILITLTGIFRNRIGVLGWNIFLFDLFILAITICFGILCVYQQNKINEENK